MLITPSGTVPKMWVFAHLQTAETSQGRLSGPMRMRPTAPRRPNEPRPNSPRLGPGDAVLVSGELGSGKTTFVRGACRAPRDRRPGDHPTFTIGQVYGGDGPEVAHLDLYRLESLAGEDPALLDDYLTPDRIASSSGPASPSRARPGRRAGHARASRGRPPGCDHRVTLLGFDTSTNATAVCVLRDDGQAFEHVPPVTRLLDRPGHAAELMPAIAQDGRRAGQLGRPRRDRRGRRARHVHRPAHRHRHARALAHARDRRTAGVVAGSTGRRLDRRGPPAAIDARRGELFGALYEATASAGPPSSPPRTPSRSASARRSRVLKPLAAGRGDTISRGSRGGRRRGPERRVRGTWSAPEHLGSLPGRRRPGRPPRLPARARRPAPAAHDRQRSRSAA